MGLLIQDSETLASNAARPRKSLQTIAEERGLISTSRSHQILSVFRAFPDDHPLSTVWDLTFHALNAMLILAIDLLRESSISASEVEANVDAERGSTRT